MLEKKLVESKALRERDLVVADRRRLAIMVEDDVWLLASFCVLCEEQVEVQKTRVARSRKRVERRSVSVLIFGQSTNE